MTILDKVLDAFREIIPEGCAGLTTEVEFYTVEKGYGLQGDCLDATGNFVRYMSYRNQQGKLIYLIHDWNLTYLDTPERWNKALVVVYKDGRTQIKSWWDEDFQRSLYNDG